ncbi:MAG: GNAT family N-acetyltransferase, partial [Actinoplanes sp.]
MDDHHFPAGLVLRTDRLTLRELRDGDIDAIVEAATNPVTMQWLPLPRPYTREHAASFVHTIAPAMQSDLGGLVRAIEMDGVLAGVIDLKSTDWQHRVTEIGYWTAPAVRGKGVMTEATV